MSKYVRTEDEKIIKITEKGCIKEFNNKLYAFRDSSSSYRFENGSEIVNQANTIEELCDEFVIVRKNEKNICLTYRDMIRHKDRYSMPYDKKCDYYAAIWTEWGLKYVAKMNDKGELELI